MLADTGRKPRFRKLLQAWVLERESIVYKERKEGLAISIGGMTVSGMSVADSHEKDVCFWWIQILRAIREPDYVFLQLSSFTISRFFSFALVHWQMKIFRWILDEGSFADNEEVRRESSEMINRDDARGYWCLYCKKSIACPVTDSDVVSSVLCMFRLLAR